MVGSKSIPITELLKMDEQQLLIFTVSRIPRTLSLILTGVGLSVSGFIMQQIAQNKFVSPTTAGSLDAAKLGILLGLIWLPDLSFFGKILFSLIFSFISTLIFVLLTKRIQVKDIILVPLLGIMFGNVLNAIATFFAVKNNIVQNVQGWLMGDFSSILQGQYETIYLIIPVVVVAYVFAYQFTLIGMGESFSKNLGLSYNSYLTIGLIVVSLTISATVVTVGAIPFLGLVIPNIVRIYKGDHLKKNLIYIALFGAIFLLVCDILGRVIIAPYEIPIGLMVGIIGGIIFFILLMRRDR